MCFPGEAAAKRSLFHVKKLPRYMNSKSNSISKNVTHFCHFVATDYQLTFQLKMSEKTQNCIGDVSTGKLAVETILYKI